MANHWPNQRVVNWFSLLYYLPIGYRFNVLSRKYYPFDKKINIMDL